jgi:hypothetical protein
MINSDMRASVPYSEADCMSAWRRERDSVPGLTRSHIRKQDPVLLRPDRRGGRRYPAAARRNGPPPLQAGHRRCLEGHRIALESG